MKYILLFILIVKPVFAARLTINEIACNTSSDWVELKLLSSVKESMRIDSLYVTMYYGTNEPLSISPVTIYSYNRPETPYDDRFVVINLIEPGKDDETDLTGDINGNGYIDIYCNNYYNSLWNSDSVVSIDTDDDPGNGGIIDFVAYSNNDGSMNSTINSYVDSAISVNQWDTCSEDNIQSCLVDIGINGLKTYMSISRIGNGDYNNKSDFRISSFQTPGRENLIEVKPSERKIFKVLKKRITILNQNSFIRDKKIPLLVYENCNIKYRVFTITGRLIYESPLYSSIYPGYTSLDISTVFSRSSYHTGLYICKIESVSSEIRSGEVKSIFIIYSKHR